MLVLNAKDIQAAVSPTDMLDTIESLLRFYQTGEYLMPLRTHLDYGDDTLLLMPCFTREAFGTKLVALFPKNTAKNKPMINALMVLNDADTGEALAVLNGRILTALRTGAVGGAGVRVLSPDKPQSLGLVGAGVQGFQQARFASAAREITRINVFDVQGEKLPDFAARLSAELGGVRVQACGSIEELLETSETIITATTSNEPVLPEEPDLLRGKHFVGIGSYKPSMREFPKCLFELVEHVYVDTEHALDESGDLVTPLQQGWFGREKVQTLGALLESGRDLETVRKGTTLFKSVGMALFDVGVSRMIYHKALEKGLGQNVEME